MVTDQDFESAVFVLALRLHLGMDGEELTEQETALYDRQIRVWGTDAQRRLLFYSVSFCIKCFVSPIWRSFIGVHFRANLSL